MMEEFYRELRDLISQTDSLKHAVLACSAAHIHFAHIHFAQDGLSFSQATLAYYCRSVSDIRGSLLKMDQKHAEKNDGFLLSIIFLFVYGVGYISFLLTFHRLHASLLIYPSLSYTIAKKHCELTMSMTTVLWPRRKCCAILGVWYPDSHDFDVDVEF